MTAGDHVRSAERLLRASELREATLGDLNQGLGDPAWDMLLRLFIDDARGLPTTIGSVLEVSGRHREVGRTFLGFLHSHRAVDGVDFEEIVRGTDDALVVRLTGRGRERMRAYFEQVA